MLYTETNIVVGIAKGQDPDAHSLIFSPRKSFRIAIPTICCMEAVTAYEREKKQRRIVLDGLKIQIREARRDKMSLHSQAFADHLTQATVEFEETSSEIGERLIQVLEQLALVAEFITLDTAVLHKSLRNQLIGDPTDNLILHCILDHAGRTTDLPKAFVSGNYRDFGQESAKSAMSAIGIRYVAKIEQATAWLSTQISP